MEQLRVLSAYNIENAQKVKKLRNKLNRILAQLEEFERLRLLGDLAETEADQLANGLAVKAGLQQLLPLLDVQAEYDAIVAGVVELQTPGTPIGDAYAAVMALEPPPEVEE